MSEPPKQRLVHLPLREFINLVLRDDQCINISVDLALLLHELDKTEEIYHIETPDDSNSNVDAILWSIRDWRVTEKRHAEAKIKAAQQKIEFENMKTNINRISMALSKLTGQELSKTQELARLILKRNPENCAALGVELVQPYYRGEYVILPFRDHNGGME